VRSVTDTKHDVHDSDTSHKQGNRGDCDQENGERLTGIELRLNDVLGIPDVEIILFCRGRK